MPRQAEALDVAWVQGYGERSSASPEIKWTDGEPCGEWQHALPCDAASGCCSGLSWVDQRRVEMVWFGSFSASSFAHELLHQHLYYLTGDGDGAHARPEWIDLLPRVNADLILRGL
jgi:hypothetical protein